MATETSAQRRAKRSSTRIEARLTPEQKAIIQHAADLEGRSLSDFVVSAAVAAAEERIRTREIITLTMEQSIRFAEALLNPPEPSERMRAAMQRYYQHVSELDQ